ncbi:MAG: putative serine/threonine-protein kinase pknH [Myxococcaceae bacterium]|nr:putative serine/threonine-protein kinase pknH [Myxococcaceae bacterium]
MVKAVGSPSEQRLFGGGFRVVEALDDDPRCALLLAEQTSTGRRCVLRVLDPKLVASHEGKKRFDQLRGLRARVHTDHLVEVLAADVEKSTGSPWFALAHLEGKTLAEYASAPLEDEDSLEILLQIAHGLSAIHDVGMVFGDLRPARAIVGKSRHLGSPFAVTLLDFWSRAWLRESLPDAAPDGVDALLWRAPEQLAAGAEVTAAADVWSFGLLAFRLITGAVFWRAGDAPEKATADDVRKEITEAPIPKASARADELGVEPGLTPDFDAWFARCVARDPAARFEGIEAAVDALAPILEGEDEAPAAPAAKAPKAKPARAAVPEAPRALPAWMRGSDFAIPAALVVAIAVAFGIRASVRASRGRTAAANVTSAVPGAVAPGAAAPEGPRPVVLTESGAAAIEAQLSAHDRGSPVWIAVAAVDPTAEATGRQLNAIFERAGWVTHPLQHPQVRARPGVFLYAESESPPAYLETVQRALNAGGLRPSTASGYRAYLAERRAQQPDYQGFDLADGQTYVIVLGRGE